MVARTIDRVPDNTDPEVNDCIRRMTDANIAYYEEHPEEIPERLRQLEAEWDIERVLGTSSASLSLAGLILGLLGNRRWLILPLAVQGFFLQHSIQGWCPPLAMFRRMGVRTADEIDRERYALETIIGEGPDMVPEDGLGAMEAESMGLGEEEEHFEPGATGATGSPPPEEI